MTNGCVLEGPLCDIVEVVTLAVYRVGHPDKVDVEVLKHSLGDELGEAVFRLRAANKDGSTDPALAMACWLAAVADCVA